MLINKIIIDSYRNLDNLELELNSKNLIIGDNGAGKTNILDAIYQLGYGKSFQLNQNKYLIKHNKEKFTIFANIYSGEKIKKIAISKNRKGNKVAKIDGIRITHQSQISYSLPIICLTLKSVVTITGSYLEKRSFINLCMFHVEPDFNELWKKYTLLLKQRNKSVKTKIFNALSIWDKQINEIAIKINDSNISLLKKLQKKINVYAKTLLGFDNILIKYDKGWEDGISLLESLKINLLRDIKYGYTTKGIHRYKIEYIQDNIPVKNIFSAAQIKLLSCCLYLSLVDLLKDKNVLLMVDDPFAELDEINCGRLLNLLRRLDVQEIITTSIVFPSIENKDNFKVFHVEHGFLKQ